MPAVSDLLAARPYAAGLLALGLCLLLAVWLPVTLFRRYMTLPLVPILGGMALFWLLPGALTLDPFAEHQLAAWERLTEAVVVISLVGAGLKIDFAPSVAHSTGSSAASRRHAAMHCRRGLARMGIGWAASGGSAIVGRIVGTH